MKKYNLLKLLASIAIAATFTACGDSKSEAKDTTTKKVETKIAKTQKVIETKPVEVKKAEVKTVAMSKVNLSACTGCHGINFDKAALGKSKIVSNMTKQEVSDALVGYKNGTYGAAMKGLMKGQVSAYSDTALRSTGLGK